jgi:hypothetical protein
VGKELRLCLPRDRGWPWYCSTFLGFSVDWFEGKCFAGKSEKNIFYMEKYKKFIL